MISENSHSINFTPEFDQMVYTARNLQFFRQRFSIESLNDFISFSIIHTIKNLRPEVIDFYANDMQLNIEEIYTHHEREIHFINRMEEPLTNNESFDIYYDTWHYLDDRKKGKIKFTKCSDVEEEMINEILKT